MKVAIIGATGQLGSDLVREFKSDAIPLTHKNIEVSDIKSCEGLKEINPDVIINTAAFHKTDECEDLPERTFAVNAIGAKNIASIAMEIGACSIYLSTDYVFDGKKGSPYIETDPPNPINTYGISKMAGEIYTRRLDKQYIFRVSSLFGIAGASGKGGNFIETMVNKAKNHEDINVVDDMIMTPTNTKEVAGAIKDILKKNLTYGTYHVTNSGSCSWYEFATAIFDNLELEANLSPTKTADLNVKAQRPIFSALSNAKLEKNGVEMNDWKEALQGYLKEKGHL